MAFLTIAGTAVDVTDFQEDAPEEIGESVRAFAGNLRTTVRATKRRWKAVTRPMLPADVLALRALFEGGLHVWCGGTALDGATVLCRLTLDSVGYVKDYASGVRHQRVLSLTLAEV
jgi:hypothetical protein